MLDYNVKIGLVPTRRDCTPRPGQFNWEKAAERCRNAVSYIKSHFTDEHVSFIDLKGINDVGILFADHDIEAVIEHFRKEKVDAVFFIAGNFGNEEAVGAVAKAIGKPVLLWGPQDDSFMPDGMRYSDSQCGLFGISRQLQRMNVPFTYIENCFIEEESFAIDLQRFLSVVCAVKNFYGLRVGQVGLRPKPFCSVIFNESELMENFDIHVIPINLAIIQTKYNRILAEKKDELLAGAEKIRNMYNYDIDSEQNLNRIYAFVLMFQEIFEEYSLGAISAECWSAMQQLVGSMPCTSYGILADMGFIIGCEGDMHATVTEVLLKCLTFGERKPFLGEFTTRHPTDKNIELLWHCGSFAYSLHKPDEPCKSINMRENFQVRGGHYTLARVDQDHGKYFILAGECDGAEGPYTFGTYLWARFKNLGAFERKIIEGPYIHHMSEIEGSYTDAIKEFCKYFPHLNFDTVE